MRGREFCDLERRRIDAGIPVMALAAMAHIHSQSYNRYQAERRKPRPIILRRLWRAFFKLEAGGALQTSQHDLVLSCYRVHLARRADQMALDVERCQKASKDDWAGWKYSAPARRQAIYLTIVCLDIRPAALAQVLELSRAAITKILREVENDRDDLDVDQALRDYEAVMLGKAGL